MLLRAGSVTFGRPENCVQGARFSVPHMERIPVLPGRSAFFISCYDEKEGKEPGYKRSKRAKIKIGAIIPIGG